ncbi:MAG: phosphate ABC transporter permease PstA [Spirochaetes bacterium]|nr:phosphate ABC transporter permease PstA [Spirochaetota bacterium]
MSEVMKPISQMRKIKSTIGINLLRFFIGCSILFIAIFLFFIFSKGVKVLSLEFLIGYPEDGMTKGGIFPAIFGTFCLTLLAIVIALPLGVLAAIFLSEYAKPEWLVKYIRLAINTLAGVPSIVFGLFGLAVFVVAFDFGASILAGGFTLAVLILPIIINTSEEAIKAVPRDFREASLGLGATKRETIVKIVVPTALPSILTGAIISVGRAAGETAPIIFTAATFYMIRLPSSVYDECMALPFHIYALMTEGTHPEFQVPIAYGTAIVLLVLVLTINLIAILMRYNLRRKRKW